MFYEKHHNTRLLMVDIFCLFYIVLVRLLSLVLFHICSSYCDDVGSSKMNELAARAVLLSQHSPPQLTLCSW